MKETLKQSPPQRNGDLPILVRIGECYKLWHGFFHYVPKISRNTLGIKIDNLFTDTLHLILTASYIPREKKLELLEKISNNIDCLKYFVTLLWELKALDTNKYSQIVEKLTAIGKMTGGWLRELKQPRT